MQNAIKKAIKLAGSQTELAKILGITPQALSAQLRKRGTVLPVHCIAVEAAFKGQVTRYELDPDHFGSGVQPSDCTIIVLQNFQTISDNL